VSSRAVQSANPAAVPSVTFQPIRLFGSKGPVMPTGLALYWQFVIHGTSLLPAREVELYERQPRRRL